MAKKYIVTASEIVTYQVEVEAENEQEAKNKVLMCDVELSEPIDSTGFQIDNVEEVEEEVRESDKQG